MGRQLDFLLHSERIGYKLTDSLSDLTRVQILFLIVCQRIYDDELKAMQEKQEQAKNYNPLTILPTDSREVMDQKIKLMKAVR
ncbi:hypothetical protein [Bacteroides sp.]|uniref:hypothetical protein n=1 Tax=Bacteroides sp. TaxID=29523 RepID=UPI0026371E2C|nr:hypothetical protein [Bacteroides sp.]MDD3039578.1 hypothetical protein [Bacteroides sp.]